jgi:hypothetical protein
MPWNPDFKNQTLAAKLTHIDASGMVRFDLTKALV